MTRPIIRFPWLVIRHGRVASVHRTWDAARREAHRRIPPWTGERGTVEIIPRLPREGEQADYRVGDEWPGVAP
jgi:hypothetical protein